MDYKMKVEHVECFNGFKVINRIPDIPEEDREKIKQNILKKLFKEFSDKEFSNRAMDERG